MTFQAGDRVQLLGHDYCGIVLEAVEEVIDLDELVSVHWGTTTAAEGRPGIPVIESIPAVELEPFDTRCWPEKK